MCRLRLRQLSVAGIGLCVALAAIVVERVSADGDLGLAPLALAQPSKSSDAKDAKNAKGASGKQRVQPSVTPEREAAVMQFVAQQHPELEVLLSHLKDANRQEYEQAIRDIFRASERLALTRERDDRRYEIELRQWQNQSQIDLLSARLKMAKTDEYREQLRGLLSERIDLKEALLRLERERLVERLKKTDQQLETIGSVRENQIDNQLRALLGTSKSAKSGAATSGDSKANKPASRPRENQKNTPSK